MKFNKAAMFGLDARIALAIFGALSVISGAALYSAIQQAQTTGLVTELYELEKAIEQYMLDTGADLTENSGSSLNYGDLLVDNSIKGWNGPYISIKGTLTTYYLDHPTYGNILIRKMANNLGGAVNTGCTVAPCYYWIQMNGLEPQHLINIDTMIDGSVSATEGKVRTIDTSDNSVFIKGPLMLKQP
tara:strand:- start:3971 stop:4531 length:561 start_codon:yes stop_codon:yes gene_type:complete